MSRFSFRIAWNDGTKRNRILGPIQLDRLALLVHEFTAWNFGNDENICAGFQVLFSVKRAIELLLTQGKRGGFQETSVENSGRHNALGFPSMTIEHLQSVPRSGCRELTCVACLSHTHEHDKISCHSRISQSHLAADERTHASGRGCKMVKANTTVLVSKTPERHQIQIRCFIASFWPFHSRWSGGLGFTGFSGHTLS